MNGRMSRATKIVVLFVDTEGAGSGDGKGSVWRSVVAVLMGVGGRVFALGFEASVGRLRRGFPR